MLGLRSDDSPSLRRFRARVSTHPGRARGTRLDRGREFQRSCRRIRATTRGSRGRKAGCCRRDSSHLLDDIRHSRLGSNSTHVQGSMMPIRHIYSTVQSHYEKSSPWAAIPSLIRLRIVVFHWSSLLIWSKRKSLLLNASWSPCSIVSLRSLSSRNSRVEAKVLSSVA